MDLPIANVWIDLGSIVVVAFIAVGLIYKIRGGSMHHFDRWEVIRGPTGAIGAKLSSGVVLKSFSTVLFRDVFTTKVLDTCSRLKRVSHLALFWGFVFLAISTTLAFLTNPTNLVLPLTDPVKIFGNAGGVLVAIGFVAMFYVRYREEVPIWRVTRSDVFMLTLFLTVVTGFVTQQAVYATAGPLWVSDTFWLHMAFVIVLLATAPFTKFYHVVSKPVSILYEEADKMLGREPVLPGGNVSREKEESP